jgi:hypothetical protein
MPKPMTMAMGRPNRKVNNPIKIRMAKKMFMSLPPIVDE